jgi:hypothetical protein
MFSRKKNWMTLVVLVASYRNFPCFICCCSSLQRIRTFKLCKDGVWVDRQGTYQQTNFFQLLLSVMIWSSLYELMYSNRVKEIMKKVKMRVH